MARITDYRALRNYMDELGLFSMDLSLGRMQRLRDAAGAEGLPPVIHVVGTNGKGSTSTFIESLARAHGLKTGLFTSPHFVTPRERVRVNGRMLPREDWVRLAGIIIDTPGGDELTYFEFQTALAMEAFRGAKVDVAVMEAGLGGRYDATNVYRPRLTVFTPVGLDHEKVLGGTLEAIAADKAGAMHPGGKAVTASQDSAVIEALQHRATEVGVPLSLCTELAEEPGGGLGLKGGHQRDNARLALAGWRLFAQQQGMRTDPAAEASGLARAFIPGRFQEGRIEGKTVFLDGAHNAHALRALAKTLRTECVRPQSIVFGSMADKDLDAMLPLLESMETERIIVTRTDWDRAADPGELAHALGGRADAAPDIRTALNQALDGDGPILVCGSLYLLGDVYSVYPELLNP
ncbi:bifunctional folylpolyglutamate synthase/dihydrofolate synthase [Desulfovibrio oxyclinae]|uniref:bifunctional folylpolyglutamate synthase/dihydrofolate synthase n=1 Tax=Desulfovibrio oxyclinae TaxID=63560 RepID=UPI000381ED64|nr:folylpolyglutamate synthase/dihydrofolate synthase family protein [Desulfovibrio oxyclinae]